MINLQNMDGLEFLESLPDNSVDLILTDPPYITSRETGMDKWVTHIQEQDKEGATDARTELQWNNYKTKEEWNQWFEKSNIKKENRANRLAKMKKDNTSTSGL